MAFPIQQAVIDFHKKFGHPVRDTPQTISEAEARQAFEFIEEELGELEDALWYNPRCGEPGCCGGSEYEPNLTEIADAGGDIIVTTVGLMARHGIDVDLVLKAIMDSNMTKEANGLGKIRKGADYKAPDIAGALGM